MGRRGELRITTYTDYSLRVLMYLALRQGERATMQEIAEAFTVSGNHLRKVTHQLQRKGFIATARGKSGGMALAHPPADISIGHVVRQMEPDFRLVECMGAADGDCVIAPDCRLRNVLGRALAAFIQVLDDCTLADLMGPAATPLRRSLGIEMPVHWITDTREARH